MAKLKLKSQNLENSKSETAKNLFLSSSKQTWQNLPLGPIREIYYLELN